MAESKKISYRAMRKCRSLTDFMNEEDLEDGAKESEKGIN